MAQKMPKTVGFFFRLENRVALEWSKKITAHINKNFEAVNISDKNPDLLIVLGGDGTILQAVKKYYGRKTLIFGLNLGSVGFLTSIRDPKKFISAIDQILTGKFHQTERIVLKTTVLRNQKIVFYATALNEVVIQNLLGVATIDVFINGHLTQHIQGTGVMVATPTGSTAWNLSAHGPIVLPNLDCLIVTELMDHNIPTPSIVVRPDNIIELKLQSFRKRNLLAISGQNKTIDVIIAADGETIFPLEEHDIIIVKRSEKQIVFAEIEENYFFKSLQEKIGFK